MDLILARNGFDLASLLGGSRGCARLREMGLIWPDFWEARGVVSLARNGFDLASFLGGLRLARHGFDLASVLGSSTGCAHLREMDLIWPQFWEARGAARHGFDLASFLGGLRGCAHLCEMDFDLASVWEA